MDSIVCKSDDLKITKNNQTNLSTLSCPYDYEQGNNQPKNITIDLNQQYSFVIKFYFN